MSGRPAPADADGRARLLRLVLLLVLGFAAAISLPLTAETAANLVSSLVARGVLAGIVAGLSGRSHFGRGESALLAALGAAFAGALMLWRSDMLAALPIVLTMACAGGAALLAARGADAGRTLTVSVIGLGVVILALLMQLGLLGGSVAETVGPGRSVALYDVVPEMYSFDGGTYIRTIDLMEHGVPYYEAHGRASEERSSADAPPPHFLNYRLPWLFRFWVALPGTGAAPVWWSLLVLTLLTVVAAYWMAYRLVAPGVALLAPSFVAALFSAGLNTHWFPFSEWWGGALGLIALALAVHRRWLPAGIVLALAIACRELMVLLIPALLIGWWFGPDRRRTVAAPLVAVLVPAFLFALHIAQTPAAKAVVGVAGTWLHADSDTLAEVLGFFGTYMPYAGIVVSIASLMAVFGASMTRPWWRRAMLFSAVVPMLLFLGLVSAGGTYWGAIGMPLVLCLAPTFFAPWFPSAVADDEAAAL